MAGTQRTAAINLFLSLLFKKQLVKSQQATIRDNDWNHLFLFLTSSVSRVTQGRGGEVEAACRRGRSCL
jgi:hypothetical protein